MLKKETLNIGDMVIYQDTELYRFTSDSVLLSRFYKPNGAETVADLCSGCGIVGVHFYALNAGKVTRADFFELQQGLHEACVKTISENNLTDKLFPHNIRVQDIPKEYYGKYTLVLCNPPYAKQNSGFSAGTVSSNLARSEEAITLKEIIYAAKRLLKFGGRFCLIHRADRLAEIMYELKKENLEPKKLQFILGADDKTPYLIMVEAVLGGKEGISVLPSIKNDRKEI